MDDTNNGDALSASGEYVAVRIPLPGADDGVAVVAVKREIAEDPEQRAAMIASVIETVRRVFPEAAVSEQQQEA